VLLPSLGDNLVQVDGEVIGREKCVGCVRRKLWKGRPEVCPLKQIQWKDGLYDQYKISFNLLGAEMVHIYQILNCEIEDNYRLTLDYTQKSMYAKKCLPWHSLQCIKLISRKPPYL
jgi:hypothetical protein